MIMFVVNWFVVDGAVVLMHFACLVLVFGIPLTISREVSCWFVVDDAVVLLVLVFTKACSIL